MARRIVAFVLVLNLLAVASLTGQARSATIPNADPADLAADLPDGITLKLLADGIADEVPASQATLVFARATIPSGPALDPHPTAGPELFLVEAGSVVVTDDLGIEGTYEAGQQFFVPMGATFSLRNDAKDAATVLRLTAGAETDASEGTPDANSALFEPIATIAVETVPAPGRLFIARMMFEPGAELPAHTFAGPVSLTGEEGVLNLAGRSGIEGQLKPGATVVLPAGINNRERNVGDEPAVVLIAGLIGADSSLIGEAAVAATATPAPTDIPVEATPMPMLTPAETTEANANESPQYPGPGPEGAPVLAWQFQQDQQFAPRAVIDGLVYFGSNEGQTRVFAIDAATGVLRWSFKGSESYINVYKVDGGVVYANTGGNHAYALDADSGQLLWTIESSGYVNIPFAANGLAFSGSEEGILRALDAATGEIRWTIQAADYFYPGALEDGILYAGSGPNDGRIYAIDQATGQERWRFSAQQGVYVGAVLGDIVYAVGYTDESRTIYALNAEAGQELWRYQLPGPYANILQTVDGAVLVAAGDSPKVLIALDAHSGQERWRYTGSEDTLFGSADEEMVLVGDPGVGALALDLESGQELWRFPLGGAVTGFVRVAGEVYLTTTSTEGTVFSLDAATGQERWRFSTGESVTVSAVAEGLVFANGDSTLYAIGGDSGPHAYYSAGQTVATVEDAVLRAAPSPIGVVLEELPAGTELTIVGPASSSDGSVWWQVTDPATGKTGYIEARFLASGS